MGIAIRIKGTLPAGNYPSLWDFVSLPQERLLESWFSKKLITQTDGLVSQWQGENGSKAIQATPARQPAFNDSAAIKFVSFDGVNDFLNTNLVLPSEGYLVIGVKNTPPKVVVSNDIMIGVEEASPNRIWLGRVNGKDGCNYGVGFGIHTMTGGHRDPNITPYGSHDVIGLHYSADRTYRLRVNGAVRYTGNGGVFTTPTSTMGFGDKGSAGGAASNPTSVQFSVIGVYAGGLSNEELEEIDKVIGAMLGRQ